MKRKFRAIRADMTIWFRSFLLLILMAQAAGCRREDPTTWNVSVAGPLAYGRITLDDIVSDSLIVADEDNLWHLMISENLTDFDLDSIVSIPDTVIHNAFKVPLSGGPWTLPSGVTLINITEDKELQLADVELKEVIASSGFLQYSVRSYVNGYLTCQYSLPGLSINGVSTQLNVQTSPSTGGVPSVAEGIIDLSGYRLNLTGTSGFSRNRIGSTIKVMTQSGAPSEAVVFGQDSVVIDLRFIDPKISYARGFFGTHTYNLSENAPFSAGFQMPEGSLDLEQVSLKFRVENYTGVDASISFSELGSVNSLSGVTIPLDQPEVYETIQVTRAIDLQGNVIPSIEEKFINTANSNINSFIENLPNGIALNGQVTINPLGDISDGNDFIYTSRAINAILEADIPLQFGAKDLLFFDTLDVNVDGDLRANGLLQLRVENHFPVMGEVTATVLDAAGNPVREVLAPATISAAMPGTDPRYPMAVLSLLNIYVSETDISALKDGGRIALRLVLNTPDYPDPVGLYSTHYIDFHLIAKADVGISVE